MGASPLVGPVDQAQMLQELDDRLTIIEQTAIIPVGIVAYCAGAVPNGWLAIDGSALDAARYGQLSNYLNGAANLPDAQGRVLVGRNAATFATLLGTGGVETVTLTAAMSGNPAHTHAGGTTGAGSPHSHGPAAGTAFVVQTGGSGSIPGGGAYNIQSLTATESAHTHTTPTVAASISTNAVAAHTNLQPYLVLIPIIKF